MGKPTKMCNHRPEMFCVWCIGKTEYTDEELNQHLTDVESCYKEEQKQ